MGIKKMATICRNETKQYQTAVRSALAMSVKCSQTSLADGDENNHSIKMRNQQTMKLFSDIFLPSI